MRDLDLADRADVPVRALSGGQRKRASIAVELLTRPSLFFLDEPTSGLDPSTAADVMRLLRTLSRRGVTVVLTTHEPAGIDKCDRVIFLARDGHLAFSGSPTEARSYFGVRDITEVYERLAEQDTPELWAKRFAQSVGTTEPQRGDGLTAHPGPPFAGQPHGRSPAMVASDAAQCRCPVPQPADSRDPARFAGAGHGDDGDAVQAWCIRSRQRSRYRPGSDRVLDRVRRLLLRPDVRPSPNRRRDGRCSGGNGWQGSAWGLTWHPRSRRCFRCWRG